MKITHLLSVLLVTLPLIAQAQATVVRVQNHQIYLDTSALKTPVNKGDSFKVILSSEKLTNPKTGKDLGLVYNYSPVGVITEVQPLYAIGKLPSETGVEIGQEALVQTAQPAPQAAAATQAEKSEQPKVSLHKKISYQPVEQEIVSLSSADITAPGAENIVTLSTKGRISVWNRNGEELKEALSYQLPSGRTPLALSAVPLRGKDTAEIFATVYDDRLARVRTVVLSYENGQWTTLDTLPYFVKEMGCGSEKTLWLQKAFVSGTRPGNAHNVVYQNGQFGPGTQELATQRSWLMGANRFPFADNNSLQLIYTTSVGRIKLELPRGKTTEYKDFSVGSPNRVKYKQEIVKFYPSLQVVESQGKPQVAAAENTTKYGLLSSTFGQYESGKIHFLSFEKGRLTLQDTVALDGFVYDTACSDTAVLTAEVLPDGQSSLVEILK
ncbi:MAG: hypothetical protein J6V32_04445 [Elusimicrobiaceae bacterium]|nr:hypothetical protein [Elusimicrobiaceae bacterium]